MFKRTTVQLKNNSTLLCWGGLLQRMLEVYLRRYNIDPRELSQEQLYKLALILQLLQGQDKAGTGSLFMMIWMF